MVVCEDDFRRETVEGDTSRPDDVLDSFAILPEDEIISLRGDFGDLGDRAGGDSTPKTLTRFGLMGYKEN